MNTKISGIIISKPEPEGGRVKFLLSLADSDKIVSCVSSLKLDLNLTINKNQSVDLFGNWIENIPPSSPVVFSFEQIQTS